MSLLVQQLLNGIATGMTLTLIALGINLIFGLFNFVNFAHGGFYVLGGYLALTCMTVLGLNYWEALVLGTILCGLFGVALDAAIFSRILGRDPSISMILTFGLALVIQEGIRVIWGPAPKQIKSPLSDKAVTYGGVYLNQQLVFTIVGSIILIAAFSLLVTKTRFGLTVRALTQDFEMAQINGVNAKKVSRTVWFLGAGSTALAGIMILPAFTLEAQGMLNTSVMAFVVVIIGGMGSLWGSVAAGLILGIATGLIEGYVATGMFEVAAAGLMLLTLWIRPLGIAGKPAV